MVSDSQPPADDVLDSEKGNSPLSIDTGQLIASTSSNEPYSVYAKKHKVAIIFTASVASFFSPMGANIYLPAINSVAADLHVSDTLINLTLTTYLVRT